MLEISDNWPREVMRQYYRSQIGQDLPQGKGKLCVEMAGNNENKSDPDDLEVEVRL
jgi:hypothetical protein